MIAACLLPGVSAQADQITWVSDSTTGLNAQVTGTILDGDQATLNYASPSGLWNANYSFSVGFDGYDSQGNALYLLNSYGGSETYWNGGSLFEAGWGDLSTLSSLSGGEYLDTNSFTDAPGSLWSANSRISISADPDDSSMLDYAITFLANGPALPGLANIQSESSAQAPLAPPPSSQIIEFSGRALSGSGSDPLILGFVVTGNGLNLLVRGVGPSLAQFGITNFLADPALTLYGSDGAVLGSNNTWGVDSNGNSQAAQIAATSATVGAFPLPAGSSDSAMLVTVNQGADTTGFTTANSTPGVALAEIYDTGSPAGTRLTDVSARGNVAAGDGILIGGFVIAGNAPKTVLIRGVGPSLASYGVTGALADPVITVLSDGVPIATNHNWGNGATSAAQMVSTAAQVGAFPLQAGSADAALLVTLQPGAYSVQLSSVGGTNGVALIEVYDTQ